MIRIFSEEHKRKLSIARKKQTNLRKPNGFEFLTQDWLHQKYIIENLSAAKISKLLGCSQKTVLRELKKYEIRLRTFSEYSSGKNNPNYGKCGVDAPFYGKKHKLETLIKMAELWDENKKQEFAKRFYGNKNPNWKGGITQLTIHVRSIKEYDDWRSFCLKRDNYTCQFCCQYGGQLNVDHIKPLNVVLKENKIQSIDDARLCQEIWDVTNGRTLCENCHKLTESYGRPNTSYARGQ